MIFSTSFSQNRLKKSGWLILLLCSYTFSFAQEVKVHGGFLSDSVKIGQETAFYLSARYPEKQTVLFPDSSFAFTPFEYQRKKYFPTDTKAGVSYDSAVYFISTYELDHAQFLALPVYLVNERDCTMYTSTLDSVLLIQLAKNVADTVSVQNLPLQANTNYHNVHFQLNYLIAVIAGAILIIMGIVIWIIFGKRISNYFRAKKLQKKHGDFVAAFTSITEQIQKTFSPSTTEAAVSMWKKYLEQLERKPYTKLTTRETFLLQKDEVLGNNLRNIDKAIYGHATTVTDSLQYLRKVADERFTKKLDEVKHGK
jgi:hypothetical protein